MGENRYIKHAESHTSQFHTLFLRWGSHPDTSVFSVDRRRHKKVNPTTGLESVPFLPITFRDRVVGYDGSEEWRGLIVAREKSKCLRLQQCWSI